MFLLLIHVQPFLFCFILSYPIPQAIANSASNVQKVPVNREVVGTKTVTYSAGNSPSPGKLSKEMDEKISRKSTNTTSIMSGKPAVTKSYASMPAAGKPSYSPSVSTYSTTATVGSTSPKSNFTDTQSRRTITETIIGDSSPRRGSGSSVTKDSSSDHWTTFNDMVERSQKEMDEMMKRHTLHSSIEPPPSGSNGTTFKTTIQPVSSVAVVPANVSTTQNVTRDGNKVTETKEHQWNDSPAPGLNRTNRVRTEVSTIKSPSGNTVGTSDKTQHHSSSEGTREETLPDGSKVKTFTKNYETRNFYSVNSNGAKAL